MLQDSNNNFYHQQRANEWDEIRIVTLSYIRCKRICFRPFRIRTSGNATISVTILYIFFVRRCENGYCFEIKSCPKVLPLTHIFIPFQSKMKKCFMESWGNEQVFSLPHFKNMYPKRASQKWEVQVIEALSFCGSCFQIVKVHPYFPLLCVLKQFGTA